MDSEDVSIDEENNDWLITYADIVTLLMAFFVMLLSMSTLDLKKYEEVSKGIAEGFMKATAPSEPGMEVIAKKQVDKIFNSIKTSIEKYAIQNKIPDQLQVSIYEDGIRIINNDPHLYKPGQAKLSKHGIYFLRRIAKILKKYPFIVHVEGHTDNISIKSKYFKSNWELSTARAINLIHGLERLGIPSRRFVAIGHGPYRPIASNKSEKGRALNRRIVLLIEKGGAEEKIKHLLKRRKARKEEKMRRMEAKKKALEK